MSTMNDADRGAKTSTDRGGAPRRSTIVVRPGQPAETVDESGWAEEPRGQRPASPVGRPAASTPTSVRIESPTRTSETAPHADPELAVIEQEVAHTRGELARTVDTLAERLRPKRLADEAKEAARDAASGLMDNAKASVRDATIGKAERMARDIQDQAEDTKSSLMDTIRENPLPAALAGLSLGWLWMHRGGSRSGTRPTYGYRRDVEYGYGAYGGPRYAGYETDEGPDPGRVVSAARERAGRVADQARETASDVLDSTGDALDDTREWAGEAFDEARGRAVGAGSSLWDTVSSNPLPAAMAAIGLAWLMRSGGESRREREWNDWYGYGMADGQSRGWGVDGEGAEEPGMTDRLADRAGDLTDAAGDMAGDAMDRAQEWRQAAQWRARRAPSDLQSLVYERPLAAAAVALGVGAAVGLAMPSTEPEGRLMGDARDTVMERAQQAVQDTGERVQRVAEEATKTVKEEAKKQELSAE